MKKLCNLFLLLILTTIIKAEQSYNITFVHDSKTVYGTFTTPNGAGPFPTIIINAGSGANDRDGTVAIVGGNAACLYPALLNDTLRPYKELSDALVDSGYAVLRYDKLEYTYPSTLGTITFHKLWLPVESAIGYVKTRSDVDTNSIIVIGHSEGSSLIPFIAKGRSDIKALISIAGARTPFDSLLAYQLVSIAQTCGGNVSQAQSQANQILSYFNIIRTNTWNGSTPALFGAPASAWYDYVRATDSVATNYNIVNLPTLFTGMELDINVPPVELTRFQNEVTITNDFWSISDVIHYMTPENDPHVSETLTDTIIYWLKHRVFTTGIDDNYFNGNQIQSYPNPFSSQITFKLADNEATTVSLYNFLGQQAFQQSFTNSTTVNTEQLAAGIYFYEMKNSKGTLKTGKVVKQ